MLFLPLLGAECRAGKEGNFAPSGQRGSRDLAAYAARTRLSLRSIFRRILVPFFCGKMVRNPIQSLSHAPHDSSLYTREPWWGRGSVASALCPREPWLGTRLCCQRPLHKGARVLGLAPPLLGQKSHDAGIAPTTFAQKRHKKPRPHSVPPTLPSLESAGRISVPGFPPFTPSASSR